MVSSDFLSREFFIFCFYCVFVEPLIIIHSSYIMRAVICCSFHGIHRTPSITFNIFMTNNEVRNKHFSTRTNCQMWRSQNAEVLWCPRSLSNCLLSSVRHAFYDAMVFSHVFLPKYLRAEAQSTCNEFIFVIRLLILIRFRIHHRAMISRA